MRRIVIVLAAAALACALASSALVGCGGDDTSSSASTVFDQSDAAGYSKAAAYGVLVWTAGHLPDSASPGDSIQKQTDAVMEGLKATLEKAGAGFDTVVMTNVYLTDFNDWEEFNATYTRYFDGKLPPRVTVQVSSLAFGNIEISMVAHVRDP
jgi:2-iminobutanoate/2-iminopropanoate deaminase